MKTLAAVLLLAVLGLTAACGGGGPHEPPGPPGRIAFTSDRSGDHEVWVMNADGSNARQLTHMPPLNDGPSWSPDGREIAFLSTAGRNEGQDIYVMDADGSNIRQLTDTPRVEMSLTFSPDGSEIAFSVKGALFLMDRDGANQHPIWIIGDPDSWSPDGKQIAYTRNTGGFHVIASEAWIVSADGTGKRKLTEEMGVADSPAWSPDGSKIAFDCARERLVVMPDVEQDPDAIGICTVNPDGSGLVRLVDGASDPAWSPDGKWLAFVRHDDIYVMRADGSDVRRITDCDCQERAPAWAPR